MIQAIFEEKMRMQNNMLNDVLSGDVSHESYANHETRTIGPDASTQATLGIGASEKFAFPQLTKRELFAALVSMGVEASNPLEAEIPMTEFDVARRAVAIADELIKALAHKPTE